MRTLGLGSWGSNFWDAHVEIEVIHLGLGSWVIKKTHFSDAHVWNLGLGSPCLGSPITSMLTWKVAISVMLTEKETNFSDAHVLKKSQ
jgi:hypothetical protein